MTAWGEVLLVHTCLLPGWLSGKVSSVREGGMMMINTCFPCLSHTCDFSSSLSSSAFPVISLGSPFWMRFLRM